MTRRDGYGVLHRVLDRVIERRGIDGWGTGRQRGPQGLNQAEERRAVKGKLGPTPGVRRYGVRHGRKLGTRQVVSIHRDKGSDGRSGSRARVGGRMLSVDCCSDYLGERSLAWMW